ncbi:hypothetical protein BFF99_09485 [Corynebacterium pseudotuberculosis]|nr:hypothetical protein BFF99_09485 [Corynebacterium pseudotuberculosis]
MEAILALIAIWLTGLKTREHFKKIPTTKGKPTRNRKVEPRFWLAELIRTGGYPHTIKRNQTMTTILCLLLIAATYLDFRPTTTITIAACTILALTLDTRAAIISRSSHQ